MFKDCKLVNAIKMSRQQSKTSLYNMSTRRLPDLEMEAERDEMRQPELRPRLSDAQVPMHWAI